MSKQLIHTDSRYHNQKLSIPYDGTIQIGPKGEATVSDRAAKALLTIPSWVEPKTAEAKGKSAPKQEAEKEELEPVESKLHFEGEEENSGLQGIDLNDLNGLELGELLEIADAAEIKVVKPMRTNKSALVAYLKSQIKLKNKLG